ncbi:helix-turn-helix transcriptional regulator [Arthrobacter ginkgonis]|uniref:Helix-turn-helix transcriptional regulator n=1 Tax=Arthrobacter ginkgonis TaxID=1630594 RepID=A0ABP7DBZ7_9MICC
MDNRNDIREFLATRRAKITPQQAGLPAYGGNRRVPGLRREEVAMLAGVSIDYYIRLERGNLRGVSDSVLDALARALQLDEAERAHLFDLARAAAPSTPAGRRQAPQKVRPTLQRVLDAMGTPAFVRNGNMDILAANRLGRALYGEIFDSPVQPPNSARFAFLDPRAERFFRDWDRVIEDSVAILRAEAGRRPYDRGLSNLIGELSTRSELFRTRWAAHNVRFHRTGGKRLNHPLVGDLDLDYEAMELPADPGLVVITYTAEPGSPSQDALNLLASWTAGTEPADRTADRTSEHDRHL